MQRRVYNMCVTSYGVNDSVLYLSQTPYQKDGALGVFDVLPLQNDVDSPLALCYIL